MNFHLRPYNQYILNIVTNIYLGLDFLIKIILKKNIQCSYFYETDKKRKISTSGLTVLKDRCKILLAQK